MLRSLSIKNIVLIKELRIEFSAGYCVFTGETGAGKSILLDALSLSLGARAEQSLLAHKAPNGYVIAEFALGKDDGIRQQLDAAGIILDAEEDSIFLKRTLSASTPSRAFINDQPVSINLLKELAGNLVEIHGQFDRLLEPREHLAFLDVYANLEGQKSVLCEAFYDWKEKYAAWQALQNQSGQERKILLEHYINELSALDPKEGEEAQLATDRERLLHYGKIARAVNCATEILYESETSIDSQLSTVLRELESVAQYDPKISSMTESLNTALIHVQEIEPHLRDLNNPSDDHATLEDVDERLALLRQIARKHQANSDDLPQLLASLQDEYAQLDNRDAALKELENKAEKAKNSYFIQAKDISKARQAAAQKLEVAVKAELPALKMDRAEFKVVQRTHDVPDQWMENGIDTVNFEVAPNGTSFGSLKQIASGGERSRFMLALKAALASKGSKTTLVFDEIDAGVGGAVASAIGTRLSKLSQNIQVLCVTHSPQVAAYANQHYRVEKEQDTQGGVTTSVQLLAQDASNKELARMLSGENITAEALAAAEKLRQSAL